MTDLAEFEEFMRAYQDMVYATAVRLLGHETDALDMAQETFLKAHERFEQLRNNPAAGGWLKTVTTNLCLNHLTRYRARWRLFTDLSGPEDDPEAWSRLAEATEDRAAEEELAHRRFHLEEALRLLPDAQRVPLVLYHFEDLSYEQIARRLGVSVSKIKTDIHRGRLALRRWLRPDLKEKKALKPRAAEAERGAGAWGTERLAEHRATVPLGRLAGEMRSA